MATEGGKQKSHTLEVVAIVVLLLLLWRWWKNAQVAKPQGANQGGYATFEADNYGADTIAYLNTVVYVDPVTGVWANGSTFTGLYDAYKSLRDTGRDTSPVKQQMTAAIKAHYPNAYV